MAAPYLGGFRITAAEWLSSHALGVWFASSYGATRYYQLYAGRTKIGVSRSPLQRTVVGTLQPSLWPQHITLLAVDPGQRNDDFGCALPKRPYNRVALRFRTDGYPADAKYLDVYAGTAPGGAVDGNNRIARELFDADGEFEITTPPLAGSGTWNFEVKGVDDKPADGNAGPALAIAAAGVLAHPPDVQLQGDGDRFDLAIASQTATVTFTEPEAF